MPVAPPRPKGPPLNALRAFEAAARLGSIARAADELCVTPGAVAQQVKALEDWAGAPLFDRGARGVRLTALGRKIAPDLARAFDALAEASHRLRRIASPEEVRIAALPSIAQLWISPRLPAIRQARPGLAVSVTAMEQPPNLMREPFDIAVFFGASHAGATGTVTLAEDALCPVCAPEIAQRLASPHDLSRETLLHDSSWRDDCAAWLGAAGVGGVEAGSGPVFSLYSLALEEAIHGAGVLIGHEPLVAAALASGALVAPFPLRLPCAAPLVATLREPAVSGSSAADVLARLADGVTPG